ncbi:helix-turn-helix domain-containing protein [Enterococcus rivorum]|uniref:DNA-binding protein n=2 Tax=Enterococcus rivorum TaxID=762845 RepID=A0A1E5L1S4_9ENTE|nr:XRE family transcriptional regulator [Enterococcus rivorum]OEH84044.1 DNA-binding protein [Enterococcus rivorum]
MELLGEKVKKLRQLKGFTLKDMSGKVGLSTGYLSQFERGITTIAVEHLVSISEVLGVNIKYFFEEEEEVKEEELVVRSYDQKVLRILNQCVYKSLSTAPKNKIMMPKLVEMTPALESEHLDSYPHQGEEFIYVLEGVLTLKVNEQEYQLFPGDSSHYPSTTPHNWGNYTNKMVKFIAVHVPSDLEI